MPVSAAMAFVVEKREWILRALRRQSERIRNSVENGKIAGVPSDPSELEHMRETARAILVPKLEAAARCHGFAYGRVAIKTTSRTGAHAPPSATSTSTCALFCFRSTCRNTSSSMNCATSGIRTTDRDSMPCSIHCWKGARMLSGENLPNGGLSKEKTKV